MIHTTESNKEEIKSFNIALFPESEQFISDCIKLAQNNFSAEADGYLLGDNAWPHITLCQFESKFTKVEAVWDSLITIQPQSLSIGFDHFYIRPGRDKHINKYWLGIAVTGEEQLTLLQTIIYNKLNELGIEGENIPSNYFPHLTLARCIGNRIPIISTLPPKEFWLSSYIFRLSIGQSSSYGVYSKQLFSTLNMSKS